MPIKWWKFVLGLVFLLGAADQAWAWGPAAHVGVAGSLLGQLVLLPAGIAAVLGRHKAAYIFGSIAADVVFAKRWSRVKQFCHHWSTAFRVLDNAADARAKAFAYGYLSHLAADTVAHGKFVPRQIMVSDCAVNFGHLYWELRVDAMESESTWRQLEEVLGHDHTAHHTALAGLITDTFLSYPLNRAMFNGMNAMAIRRQFRRTMHVWSRCSRWYLSPDLLHGYRTECLDRIHSILREGSRSPLLREDPNGTSALMQLRVRRREVRRLRRRGLPVERRLLEASLGLSPTQMELLNESGPEPARAFETSPTAGATLHA